MAKYLFAAVGGRDVQFKPDYVNDNELCSTNREGKKVPQFINPRETGKTISDNFCIYIDKIEYPIIDPVIAYCKIKDPLNKIFLFVSNQNPPNRSDTLFLGEIMKKHFENELSINCEIIELAGSPVLFDDQYNAINKELSRIEPDINPAEDSIFVFPQSSTPEIRNALLLNCILYFPKTKQLAKPQKGKVTEQHFPQTFREQVRIKSLKSTLKETLATISARNLSHTDGSHVMISYQKNLREKLDEIKHLSSTSKIDNLKEEYDAFSDYLRGQMEYIADINGQTASHTFFDYNFKREVEKLGKIINFFLGKGLIDDLKQKNGGIETEVQVSLTYNSDGKIVSIPGGSNGINAFYTILKNFIRNLYKHSSYVNNDIGSPVYNINIQIDDSHLKDYYKVTIYDDLLYVSSAEIIKIIDDTGARKGIKSCIDDKLLNSEGAVRDYGWGILEMKIAACYLIGLPLMFFDEPVNKKNVIDLSKKEVKKVFPRPLEVVNCENHLAYVFYLRKPETFYVITSEKPKNEDDFQKVGINFSGNDEDTDLNTCAKFIIKSTKEESCPLKLNNIRQINFIDEDFASLLNEEKRKEIILNWQKRMFSINGHFLDKYKKIDLPSEDNNIDSQAENLIIIDSHGNEHKEKDFSKIKSKGYFYYSTLCSKDNLDIPSGKLEDLKWEEIEAIFTKVAVLDERIQNKVNEAQNYIHNLSKRDLLELRGIFVPPLPENEQDENAFDLRSFIYGNQGGAANVDRLETIIKSFMKDYHYVVLHFSILEKMAEMKNVKLSDYYNDLVNKVQVEYHYLILTSGKGTPSTLPEGAYFISFSSVERAVNSLSKIELIQHLNALRIYHKSNKP